MLRKVENMIGNMLYTFFLYGFLGWVLEVVYHAIMQNRLVNRGFLNGAICPIYGVGMVVLTWFLRPVENNIVMLFAGSVVLCSVLELITGFALEKIFRTRWWDYSNEKFNIKGYICLKFSLAWGIAGIVAVRGIDTGAQWIYNAVPEWFMYLVLGILTVLLVIDCAATVIDIAGFNKELTSLDEFGEMIKVLSDDMTDNIYRESKDMAERLEERFGSREEAAAAFEARKNQIYSRMTRGQKRIIRAFPGLKGMRHRETVAEIAKRVRDEIRERTV